MPTKQKQLTEKQALQLMTKRRTCIQKYRKSYKNKTISFSNPNVSSVQEIPKETKKRTYKKKPKATEVEPLGEVTIEEPQPKKKRTYKKKIEATEPLVEDVVEPLVEVAVEEPQPKKKRTYKKKTAIEEPKPTV